MDKTVRIEFYSKYTDPLITNEDLTKAYAFKETFIPEVLYRYRRFTENTLNEIRNSKVRLSPASNQNDPHDSSLRVDVEAIAQVQAKQNIERFLQHVVPPPSAEERAKVEAATDVFAATIELIDSRNPGWAAERNAKFPLIDFLKMNLGKIDNFFSSATQIGTLVCSFTESAELPSMWKEYANDGRGICIEYPMTDLSAEDHRRKHMFPVIYDDAPFDATADFIAKIKEPDRRNRVALGASMRKKISWEHEREWRLVAFMGRKVDEQFEEMPTPSRIYLGKQISSEDERRVREAAAFRGILVENVFI